MEGAAASSERMFACLQNFRRLVRCERYAEMSSQANNRDASFA